MVVHLLLTNATTVDATDRSGRTSLSHAADAGHEDLARLLLEHRGRTPISYATEDGHESVVRLPPEHSAAVDTADVNGQTPLSYATKKHNSMIRKLLERNFVVDEACES
jgi:ankyrin repeat protein